MESDPKCEENSTREQCRRRLRSLSIESGTFSENESILEDSCANLRLNNDDVKVGNILGKGCFSSVRTFEGLKSVDNPSINPLGEFSGTAKVGVRKYCYYAVKSLRKDLSEALHETGVFDLAMEAQFLTSLSHKNIVSLEAHGDDPGGKDFFIIIERVERTLTEEIKTWRFFRSRLDQFISNDDKKKIICTQVNESILPCALGIVSALKYLHEKNIIFRDLKGENIGFDFENNPKLFDFGLATELRQSQYVGPDQYKCTIAGSLRYMSPEVGMGKPYGAPADIYSFGILLNEMISQKKPFHGMTVEKQTWAIRMRRRPPISKTCPQKIGKLIQSSWNNSPRQRPPIQKVQETINAYLLNEEFK